MYKVKDAADQLGVTRVEIFEILLSQRELFDPYVVKNNSITYISDEGMALLKKVLTPEAPEEIEKAIQSNQEEGPLEEEPIAEEVLLNEEGIEKAESLNVAEEQLPEKEKVDEALVDRDRASSEATLEDEPMEEDESEGDVSEDDSQVYDMELLSDDFFSALTENPSVSKIESEDLLVGQWLKEIQIEDDQAMQLDFKLKDIRGQVTGLRNKIMVLDSEIKRKDEAIKHYHEIMKDDLRWLEDMEHKVQLIVKNHLDNAEQLEQEQTEEVPEEEKGNFFKFFKRQ